MRVSLFCFVRNRQQSIGRAIDSLLAQTYPDVEIVVQDGASTDGTLEVLRGYGDRIRLVSEPDRCAQDGMFRALRRCTGDLIGSCLSDEELLPHAAEWAVRHFRAAPECGAIYGDTILTDGEGRRKGIKPGAASFTLRGYLLRTAHMELVSTFFRRAALERAGLHTHAWNLDAPENEVILRLGRLFPIRHFPGLVGRYAVHPGGLSQQREHILRTCAGMEAVIDRFCSEPETPADIRRLRGAALASYYLVTALTLIEAGDAETAWGYLGKAAEDVTIMSLFLRAKHLIGRRTGRWLPTRRWRLLRRFVEQWSAPEPALSERPLFYLRMLLL